MAHPPAYVALQDVFTPDELDWIVAWGDQQPMQTAQVSLKDHYHTARQTRIAWLRERTWVTARIEQVLRRVNDEYYRFMLDGLEPLQYSVYGTGDYFDWHLDVNPTMPIHRKLSLSVQLSEPTAYADGELMIKIDAQDRPMPTARGAVIVFPSFILHRVTAVTRGVRRALVAWIGGPPFR